MKVIILLGILSCVYAKANFSRTAKKVVSKAKDVSGANDQVISGLLQKNKQMNRRLDELIETPLSYDSSKSIFKEGDIIKVMTNMSINSKTFETPVIAYTSVNGSKYKVLCKAINAEERVSLSCHKMIGSSELRINANALELDGSYALRAQIIDNNEDMIEGKLLDSTIDGLAGTATQALSSSAGLLSPLASELSEATMESASQSAKNIRSKKTLFIKGPRSFLLYFNGGQNE